MCLILHVNLDALLLIPLGWYSVSSKVVTAKVHEGNSNEFFLRLSGGKLSWWHRRNTVEYRSKESDTLSIIAPNAYSSWWTEKLGNETNGVGASEKLIAQIENVFCKKRYMEIRTILWVNWLDSECIVALISAVQLEISIYFLSAGSLWRRNLSVQRCFPKPKLHVGALCFENWKLRIENWEEKGTMILSISVGIVEHYPQGSKYLAEDVRLKYWLFRFRLCSIKRLIFENGRSQSSLKEGCPVARLPSRWKFFLKNSVGTWCKIKNY